MRTGRVAYLFVQPACGRDPTTGKLSVSTTLETDFLLVQAWARAHGWLGRCLSFIEDTWGFGAFHYSIRYRACRSSGHEVPLLAFQSFVVEVYSLRIKVYQHCYFLYGFPKEVIKTRCCILSVIIDTTVLVYYFSFLRTSVH